MVNGTYFVHKVWLCVFQVETWNEDRLLNKFNCVVNLPCARGKPAWRIATMWNSIECLCRRRLRGCFDLHKHKRGLGFENMWTLFGILVVLFFVYQTFLFMTHFRPLANSCQLSYRKTYIRLNSGSDLLGSGAKGHWHLRENYVLNSPKAKVLIVELCCSYVVQSRLLP